MTYTVQGKPLRDCTMNELRREAEAGHWLKANGGVSDNGWAKLEAVETEIEFRLCSAPISANQRGSIPEAVRRSGRRAS